MVVSCRVLVYMIATYVMNILVRKAVLCCVGVDTFTFALS